MGHPQGQLSAAVWLALTSNGTNMEKCWAYYPIAGTREAWIPCVRNAIEGSHYCRRHEDVITGALLGQVVHGPPVDEAERIPEEPPPSWMRRLKKSVGRTGKCTTRSQGLRADLQENAKRVMKLESPADDPLAGNLRESGGSERGRGARTPECAR